MHGATDEKLEVRKFILGVPLLAKLTHDALWSDWNIVFDYRQAEEAFQKMRHGKVRRTIETKRLTKLCGPKLQAIHVRAF